MNILIVDDRPVDAKLLRAELVAEGHTVREAPDGVEALALLNREHVDAIISDILMPKMDGFRLCYEVRQSERLRKIPFIFYTASYTSPDDEKLCLDLGAHKYLRKPAKVKVILAALHEAANSGARRAPSPSVSLDETDVLKQYNGRLVKKLEEKNVELALHTTALESAANAVMITDAQGGIIWVNPAFTALTGYTAEEAVGKNPRVLKSGRHDQAFYHDLWRTILGGHSWCGEFINCRKGGSLYHSEQTITPVRTHGGPITHFIGIMTDLTERKRAEIHIQHLNRVYAIVSGINQVIVRVRESQEMFEAACRIAVEKGGFRMAWIGLVDSMRKSVRPVAYAGVADDDLEKLKVVLGDDSRGHGPIAVALRDGTHVVCNDTGRDPQMTPWYEDARRLGCRALAVLPLSVGGEMVGTFNLCAGEPGFFDDEEMHLLDELAVDIGFALEVSQQEAERQRAAESLRASEARYRTLTDSAQDAIFIINRDFCLEYINEYGAKQFGHSVQEMVGRHLTELFPPETTQWQLADMADVFRTGKLLYQERQFPAGQRLIWLDTRLVPIKNATGEVESILGISRDITARKLAEGQMLRAQRLESIGNLASGVAHDLNNALAPVLMTTELLRLEFPDTATRYLDVIESGTRRGADMVRQLLTFAKGTEGERLLIQPRYLLKEMAKLIESTFPKNIQLRTNYATDLRAILGDATQLHQVLLNLCVNARDAMPDGGTLTLQAENMEIDATDVSAILEATPGNYVVWRVADTGTGIPPELQDRIFEPFFTTKGLDKGTGLGLSTVIGIVKSHGGFLQVYSVPGQGSTFAVYLPAFGSGSSDTALLTKPDTTFRGNGETILVVDDEAVVREIMRTVLTKLNFKVLTAADATTALIQMSENQAELRAVITDLHMPHMDGLSLVRVVKGRLPRIGIIVISGRLDEREVNQFKQLGVSALLDKPFTQDQLVEALKTIFEK